MSWFNRALEICEDEETQAYFRARYWAKSHKTGSAREKAAEKARSTLENLTPEQRIRAGQAIEYMNDVKRQRNADRRRR